MNNNDLFKKVKDLKLPTGKYALFGSAPLGIRGLRDCRDIDIVVTQDLWDEYMDKGWEMKTMTHGGQYLLNGDIELWKDWKPGEWDIEELIAEAEMIDGLSFVRLEKVLEGKKLSGREKDFEDIKKIKKFLRGTGVDNKTQ